MKRKEKRKALEREVKRKQLKTNSTMVAVGLAVAPIATTPTLTVLASETLASSQSEQEIATEEVVSSAETTINNILAPSEVSASDDSFEVEATFFLNPEDSEVEVSVSPNFKLNSVSGADLIVKNEAGKEIGTLEVNEATNKAIIHLTDSANQAKFNLSLSLKDRVKTTQVLVIGVGESRVTHEMQISAVELEVDSSDDLIEEGGVTEETVSTAEKEQSTEETMSTEPTSEVEVEEVNPEEAEVDNTDNSSSEVIEEESTGDSSTESSEEKEVTEEISDIDEVEVSKEEVVKEEESPVVDVVVSEIMRPRALAATAPAPSMARTYSSQEAFIADTAYHAQQVAGPNDLYASVMIAQACLESGFGGSTLSSPPNHNLFGIKGAYNGQSVTMQTWEVYNGQTVWINAQFRKYPSYRESFEDNAHVLKTTSFYPGVYYYSGAWKSNTNTYRDATKWLTGRYATDPLYNTKLNNIIESYGLTKYDSGTAVKPPAQGGGGNTTPSKPKPTGDTYTVKSGDTLSGIGYQHNVTVAQLKQWNGLTSDLIFPGQVLKVKAPAGGNTGGNTSKPKPTPDNGNKAVYHTVSSGETLYGIANKYGTTVSSIKSLNGLKGDMIYPNQRLLIKGNKPANGGGGNVSKPAPTPSNDKYTVNSGDTLYSISFKYGMTVNELKSLNGLTSDTIYPGQQLKVKGSAGSTSNVSTQKPASSNQSTYIVKSGDTLYGIALSHNTTVSELKRINGLKSDMIYVGQTLKANGSSNVYVSTGNQAKYHTVVGGDTLYGLSIKYGTTINKIKSMNNLKGDIIYPGQRLKVK